MLEKKAQQNKPSHALNSNISNKKEERFKKSHSNFFVKTDDFEERVVKIRRVVKVTKGGRRFRFSATVVVGNNKGKVGFATCKANEVPDAIKKAVRIAKSPKNLITIKIVKGTIPHTTLGQYCSGSVLLKPAKKGTGIIAGGPIRTLIEVSGIHNIYSKSLRSNTPVNAIRATIDAFNQLRTANEIKNLRADNEIKKAVKER